MESINYNRYSIFKPFLCACLYVLTAYADDTSWTWLYQKHFTEQEHAQYGKGKTITVMREAAHPYTQLVFSWNAVRPEKGFFSFWVQSRDKESSAWSDWYRMFDWGAGVQCSYMSKEQRGIPQYAHVRLETGSRYANAFRVKVIAHDDAALKNIKSIFVCLSDFTKFKAEDTAFYENLPTIIIPNVPKKSQMALDHERNFTMCSPTSCSMLVSFLLGKDIDPISFAQYSYDNGLKAYGSWPFNMAHAYECCGSDFYFTMARLSSFAHLYSRLQRGIPIVVSVRGYMQGAPKPYDKGHLLVVVGYDGAKQEVICHDPAFKYDHDTVTTYALKDFLASWERSNRLSYLAEPTQRS